MTRTRRTTALIAAAALALGVTACSPPSENDSKETAAVTEVTPDSGYEGAGKATTSDEAEATDETAAPAGEEAIEGAEGAEGAEGEAATEGTAGTAGAEGAAVTEPTEPVTGQNVQ
ncbi:MAG TPA: hypothetical protein H9870_11290 [Candidatus Corynebacterium avicola]|uniref:Uncharacterized protein n=1 Tax=Candidatus Corynebacterium avicola TaxID=2838527 RepID=A0A9D1RRI3_9CORY|nr:hypothetical protein [Candidatus Corynebacterium avicola]